MVLGLKWLFSFGGGPAAPPKATKPPVPTGEWFLIVDSQGNHITDRAPQPGDMLARPAIKYRYNGTIPGFEPSRSWTTEQNMRARMDYEIRSARNKELIEKAVFLLSQTDDGRRLLYKAHQEEFSFVFDDERLQGEQAVGLCDYSNKLVPLAEGRSPEEVALTIKHELQHMEDIGKGLSYNRTHTLKAATIANRALESNARVSEAVFAMEAMIGSPNGPADQFKTHAIFHRHRNKNLNVGTAAMAAKGLAEKGDWPGFANAVFPAYYRQDDTLAYYDKRNIEMYAKYIPDIKKEKELTGTHEYYEPFRITRRANEAVEAAPKMFWNSQWNTEMLGYMLTIKGLSFLKPDKNFSPDQGRSVELTPAAVTTLDNLKARLAYLNIKVKEEALAITVREPEASSTIKGIFAAADARIAEPEFQPIVLPCRLDGSLLTSGETSHAWTTKAFGEIFTGMKSGRTQIDRLNYSIDQYVRHSSSGNIMARVGSLLEAGLLAPIGAFPPEYLHDLVRRLHDAAQTKHASDISNPIRPREVRLFRHWQEMAMKGYSPAWLDKQTEAESYVNDRDAAHWIKYIFAAIPGDPLAQQQPTVTKPAPNI